jgi:hypothetical protein
MLLALHTCRLQFLDRSVAGRVDVLKLKGEKTMSNQEDNRVLARSGARELTLPEIDRVSAAAHTNVCSAAMATTSHTGFGDGDGCGDTDTDASFI